MRLHAPSNCNEDFFQDYCETVDVQTAGLGGRGGAGRGEGGGGGGAVGFIGEGEEGT